MLALIGAGYTLQRFKNLYDAYDFHETHRDTLEATEKEIKGDLSFLEKAHGLIFSLTPSLGALNLVQNLHFDKKAILLSSIGVYQKSDGDHDESCAIGTSERAMLIHKIEMEFLKLEKSVVLRLGGLYDSNRHPINSILKRGSTIQANELINFVHIDDVCEAIHTLLKNNPKERIYNLVEKNHPTKRNYYTALTSEPINFSDKSDLKFQVDSTRFINEFETSEQFLNRI